MIGSYQLGVEIALNLESLNLAYPKGRLVSPGYAKVKKKKS